VKDARRSCADATSDYWSLCRPSSAASASASENGIQYLANLIAWLRTHAVEVLNERGHFFVLHEQIVAAGHVLHDVPLDLLILQHCQPVVYQDRWRRCFKIGPGFQNQCK
jgi:hypothetical protein